jgi:hypothetical protein
MNYLNGTIDRIEDNQVIIKLENGSTLLWPKEKLPNNLTEGSALKLNILTDTKQTKNKEDVAKNILNEILQSE